MLQLIFIIATIIVLMGILWLFIAKAGLQLQYKRMKQGKKRGSGRDFLRFSFSDKKARQERWEAFLLFPMLYPIVLDDQKEELNNLKRRVKRIHIIIYLLLIVLVVLGVYSEKVFPS